MVKLKYLVINQYYEIRSIKNHFYWKINIKKNLSLSVKNKYDYHQNY